MKTMLITTAEVVAWPTASALRPHWMPRMQPAIDHLAEARLHDGGWPLRLSFRPEYLPAPERRSKTRSSPMVTLRAASAFAACGAEPT